MISSLNFTNIKPKTIICISAFSYFLSINQIIAETDTKLAKNCPAQEAGKFIELYSESLSYQRKFVEYPLKYTYVINNPGSPNYLQDKSIVVNEISSIPYVTAKNPFVFPNKNLRNSEGLDLKITDRKSHLLINLYRPDTDYIILFSFIKRNSCWYLKSINSKSL